MVLLLFPSTTVTDTATSSTPAYRPFDDRQSNEFCTYWAYRFCRCRALYESFECIANTNAEQRWLRNELDTIAGLLMLINADDEAPDTTSSTALIGGFSNNIGTGASYINVMYIFTCIHTIFGPISVVQSTESRVYKHTYLKRV
uniref:Uncharacterized protein n=1 Tax=Bactrocera dorsalis TaxID=27457 RepID=A0A034W277_BACDO